MLPFIKKYCRALFILIAAFALITVTFVTDGTADSGDSVTHYLFARWAPAHPSNFFDHWAKPVFVLLAFPFAQFGFAGMKLFNITVALLTLVFTMRLAKKLEIKIPVLSGLFLLAFPLYTISIFSGLTEPLFGLMLTAGIFFLISGVEQTGLILLSFLPFCRSEGLIVLPLVAAWLIVKKMPRHICWLLTGHLFYSFIGVFLDKDMFWVFSQIPYVTGDTYGRGGWLHFFEQAPYIFGIPLLIPLLAGLLSFLAEILRPHTRPRFFTEELVLVAGTFLAVFFAHVIFWKFGLFKEAGLKRVIVAVLPPASLIALKGLNSIYEMLAKWSGALAKIIFGFLVAYSMVFPFTPNPAAFHLKQDFCLGPDQLLLDQAAALVKNQYPGATVYSSHNYLAMALDVDFFDRKRYNNLNKIKADSLPLNSVIVWDDWYAVHESGISAEVFEKNTHYSPAAVFEKEERKVIVFLKIR